MHKQIRGVDKKCAGHKIHKQHKLVPRGSHKKVPFFKDGGGGKGPAINEFFVNCRKAVIDNC